MFSAATLSLTHPTDLLNIASPDSQQVGKHKRSALFTVGDFIQYRLTAE